MIYFSAAQKEFLVEHIDGPRPCGYSVNELRVRNPLLAEKLITYEPGLHITSRPRHTALTDKGREALCMILSGMIETLMKCDKVFERRSKASASERENLLRNLLTLRRWQPSENKKYGYGFVGHDAGDGENAVGSRDRSVQRSSVHSATIAIGFRSKEHRTLPVRRTNDGSDAGGP